MQKIANALSLYRGEFDVESLMEAVDVFFERYFTPYVNSLYVEVYRDENSLWLSLSCARFNRMFTFSIRSHFHGTLIDVTADDRFNRIENRFLGGDWSDLARFSDEIIWRLGIECKNKRGFKGNSASYLKKGA